MLRSLRQLSGASLLVAASLGFSEAAAQETIFIGSGSEVAETGAPDYYVIQSGDTLWEISSRFLGNPYYWPRLWSINEYITNPHWIYPGNRVVFRMGTLIEPPQVSLDDMSDSREGYQVDGIDYGVSEAECGADVRFDFALAAESYNANGLLAEREDIDIYGTVERARTMQTYLAERDLLYLKLDDPNAFDCGDRVSLYRMIKKKVRHPESRRTKFGDIYRIVGDAKVVHRYGDYVSAVITTSYTEVHRGDLVGPSVPTSVQMEVSPPRGDLDGYIVGRLTWEAAKVSTRETVFIDRGRADGVRVGNSFYVVSQRDENVDWRKENVEVPESVVGRLVVVRVDEYSSTAVITDASHSLDVGMRITQDLE